VDFIWPFFLPTGSRLAETMYASWRDVLMMIALVSVTQGFAGAQHVFDAGLGLRGF
jgi:hypothetical protein